MRCFALFGLIVALGACGSVSGKAEGDRCAASSECSGSLVCNLNANPPVCAKDLSFRFMDARVKVDGSLDGAVAVDGATPIDAAQPIDGGVTIDAAQPIDAATAIDAAIPDARLPDATVPDAQTGD